MSNYFAHAPKDAAFADANLKRNVNRREMTVDGINGADDDTNKAGHSSH